MRGFALLGIFIANIRDFSGYALSDLSTRTALTGPNTTLYESLQATIVDGKFYTLFSLLFGIGFAIQLKGLETDPNRSARTYLRRTLILLVIGIIHLVVFWIGDILTFYALLGFFLFLFRNASDRTVLWAAAAMFCVPLIGYVVAWASAFSMDLGFYARGTNALRASFPALSDNLPALMAVDTWADFFAFTTSSFWLRIGYNFESWRMPKLAFIMLVGLWVGRQILAGALLNETKKLWTIAVIGISLGLSVGYIYGLLGPVRPFAGPANATGLARMATYMLSVFPMGFAYAALFALLWKAKPSALKVFCAPGRMALTNYLMQTFIGITIFYGVGFGYVLKVGFVGLTLIAFSVFAFQAALSWLWLQRFRYGPAEWIWRCLTYGQLLPIRRA
ncbi:MAG: DUF418 domain-containing protein [Pseudomonadota bacterium]